MFRFKGRESRLSRRKNWSNFVQLSRFDSDIGRKLFVESYTAFMQKTGLKIQRIPIMAKRPLDLYRLFVTVQRLGGFEQVVKHRQWSRVVRELQLPSSITSAAFTLRTQYYKFLFPYEHSQENILNHIALQQTPEKVKSSLAGCFHLRAPSTHTAVASPFSMPRQCCGHPEMIPPCLPSFKQPPFVAPFVGYDNKRPYSIPIGVKNEQSAAHGSRASVAMSIPGINKSSISQEEAQQLRAKSEETFSVSDDTMRHSNSMFTSRPASESPRGYQGNGKLAQITAEEQRKSFKQLDLINAECSVLKKVEHAVRPILSSKSSHKIAVIGCSSLQSTPPCTDPPGQQPHGEDSCTRVHSICFQRRDMADQELCPKNVEMKFNRCQDRCQNDDVKLHLKMQSDKILLATVVLNNVPFEGALFAEIEK